MEKADLHGSEKQIDWASKIREYVIKEITAGMSEVEFDEKDLPRIEILRKAMKNDQASFWIETFQPVGSNKLQPVFDYLGNCIGSRRTGNKICEAINKLHGFE